MIPLPPPCDVSIVLSVKCTFTLYAARRLIEFIFCSVHFLIWFPLIYFLIRFVRKTKPFLSFSFRLSLSLSLSFFLSFSLSLFGLVFRRPIPAQNRWETANKKWFEKYWLWRILKYSCWNLTTIKNKQTNNHHLHPTAQSRIETTELENQFHNQR